MSINCPKESQEQIAVVHWFKTQYPQYKKMIIASANGAHLAGTSKQRAAKIAKMKAEGFAKGFPDLQIAVSRGHFHGLYIEMKRQKGGIVSEEQKEYINLLTDQGYAANICRGADEAIQAIKQYMGETMCGECWLEHGDPVCTGQHAFENGYS